VFNALAWPGITKVHPANTHRLQLKLLGSLLK
jgi:hypothetical protein